MRGMITMLGLSAGIFAFGTPGHTQQYCADRSTVTERLKASFGESFAGGGLRNQQSIVEVRLSKESGTWTILMTLPDGRSCVMASGTNWRVALPSDAVVSGIPG